MRMLGELETPECPKSRCNPRNALCSLKSERRVSSQSHSQINRRELTKEFTNQGTHFIKIPQINIGHQLHISFHRGHAQRILNVDECTKVSCQPNTRALVVHWPECTQRTCITCGYINIQAKYIYTKLVNNISGLMNFQATIRCRTQLLHFTLEDVSKLLAWNEEYTYQSTMKPEVHNSVSSFWRVLMWHAMWMALHQTGGWSDGSELANCRSRCFDIIGNQSNCCSFANYTVPELLQLCTWPSLEYGCGNTWSNSGN